MFIDTVISSSAVEGVRLTRRSLEEEVTVDGDKIVVRDCPVPVRRPSRAAFARFLRIFDLAVCARCGLSRSGDRLTVEALMSVAIESPVLTAFFCACPRPGVR